MKLTQCDLCVIMLSEQMGWTRVCEMAGRPFRGQFIGSQADKRMWEVMEQIAEKGFYEVECMRYHIEAGRDGKFKTYKVVTSTPKPQQQVIQMFSPDGRPYVKLQMV